MPSPTARRGAVGTGDAHDNNLFQLAAALWRQRSSSMASSGIGSPKYFSQTRTTAQPLARLVTYDSRDEVAFLEPAAQPTGAARSPKTGMSKIIDDLLPPLAPQVHPFGGIKSPAGATSFAAQQKEVSRAKDAEIVRLAAKTTSRHDLTTELRLWAEMGLR